MGRRVEFTLKLTYDCTASSMLNYYQENLHRTNRWLVSFFGPSRQPSIREPAPGIANIFNAACSNPRLGKTSQEHRSLISPKSVHNI